MHIDTLDSYFYTFLGHNLCLKVLLITDISKKYPYPHIRDWNFLGMEGGGFSKTKNLKEMYELILEFSEGWGNPRKSLFHGGGMDIFWTCTYTVNKHIL